MTKSEWMEWKESQGTEALIGLLKLGKITAMEELQGMRGEVGDFPRGANFAYDEILEIIRMGWDLYDEETQGA